MPNVPTDAPVIEIVSEGLQGPQGRSGILLLEHGASIPPGTPPNTIVFEKEV